MSARNPILLAVALSLAITACKPQTDATVAPTAAAPGAATTSTEDPATPTPAASCPDASFDAFIQRFSADIAAQKKATADPLTMVKLDPDAQPEPAPVSREVPLAQIEWPVIPNLESVRTGGREVVTSGEGASREVLVRTSDTGDQQVYVFTQQPCWTLTKVDDQAL